MRKLVMLGGRDNGAPEATASEHGGAREPVATGAVGEEPTVLPDDDLPF